MSFVCMLDIIKEKGTVKEITKEVLVSLCKHVKVKYKITQNFDLKDSVYYEDGKWPKRVENRRLNLLWNQLEEVKWDFINSTKTSRI